MGAGSSVEADITAWANGDAHLLRRGALALVLFALATAAAVWVASVVSTTHWHRTAAAFAAVSVLATLCYLVHVSLLWYQLPESPPASKTLSYRQRGLKGAVIGADGRASTSKAQIALWTAAIVSALIFLLLLTRSYPGGTLFTNAVTKNWHPEYLVLIGLPVAAATTVFAAVANSNNGKGPVPSAQAQSLKLQRVYTREAIGEGVHGVLKGLAELVTNDAGAVSMPDLQYVVFTLIAFVSFTAQLLASPAEGLPPVPAALLTLMGVSAAGYAGNKIVETLGSAT
ncbi:MAG: hypothetical protein ABSG36_16395 [Acidimicrobiales bacterium]|jgi:hypothetical protein